MKLCDISSGLLKHRITIERVTRTSDGQGGFKDVWAADPAGGVFAYMRYLTGTERWEAKRVQAGDLCRGIIRFRGDANGAPYYEVGDKVTWRGMEFAMLSVQDIEFERKYLQLDLMLGKPT